MDVLILDEPTSALDPAAAHRITAEAAELHETEGVTVVLVSHDLARTAGLCDRLLIMDRERNQIRIGPTEELMQPEVLQALYGLPVEVLRRGRRYLIGFGEATNV